MDIRERFCKKVHDELVVFKKEILRESKSEILNSSYKTEVIVNLYEILMENVGDFSDALLNNLVSQGVNILESLYNDFISDSGEDVLYEDIKQHVEREFDETNGSCFWENMHEGGVA